MYLCYLYLATHEVNKAWSILDSLATLSFEGTLEELQMLSWIINALPVSLEKKHETLEKIKTPEYTACQLKALSTYIEFLKLGKEPHFNEITADTHFANAFE